ncbi:MAG: hypothetical protein D3904_07970 [Candidatus Electrothrix sp. EH2]|nr:hypothetical protein [Candidatus Electrothrix sp. EH2]
MRGKKILMTLAMGLGSGIFLSGCGSDLPFSAKYTSPNQVIITYQGKLYTLNRYGIPASTPFKYRFENDGDLDLNINGEVYEVDSPYDRDKKKKKIKKKPVKKKSASRTRR